MRWLVLVGLGLAVVAYCSACKGDGPSQADKDRAVGELDLYKRKSMAAEAKLQVGMMARSAQMEHAMAAEGPDAKPLASAPMTPPAGACCKSADRKCAPDKALWEHPAWKAINFYVDDAHRYSYELVVAGDQFTARAVGDLDCDGVLSTYQLAGRLGADESLGELEVIEAYE